MWLKMESYVSFENTYAVFHTFLPRLVVAVKDAGLLSVLDSSSTLFLVERSMGELLLGVAVVCLSAVDVLSAASALLDDGPDAGISGVTAGLLEASLDLSN